MLYGNSTSIKKKKNTYGYGPVGFRRRTVSGRAGGAAGCERWNTALLSPPLLTLRFHYDMANSLLHMHLEDRENGAEEILEDYG